jgi:drug/metabolite transporter (DMT)-like permease
MLMLWAGRHQVRPTLEQVLTVIGLSVLGFTAYFTWLAYAIQLAGTEVPALVIGTVPIWVMLLGKPKAMHWSRLIPGLLLTLAGLGLMAWAVQPDVLRALGLGLGHWLGQVSEQELAALPVAQAARSSVFWRGVFWVSLSTLSWTVFSLWNAKALARYREVSASVWANWLGIATGVGACLMWWWMGTDAHELAARDDKALAAGVLVVTGIGSAWLATVLWNMASQRLSASLCGQMIVSETLFALMYSHLWEGTWPGPWHLAAAAVFCLGIVVAIGVHR